MPGRTRVVARGDESTSRTRPKNRKAQIAAVAAEAFSERGYHAVGIDDIASAVGVSGPALYRHFPTKYALFVHAVENLSRALLDAADSAHCESDDPRQQLQAVMVAVIGVTLENRRRGGLYRWEGRYLEKVDRENLRLEVVALRLRVSEPLAAVRPELGRADLDLVTAAILSVIGSVTGHRSALPPKQIESLMLSVCWSVIDMELPQRVSSVVPSPGVNTIPGLERTSKREVLLHEAVLLFHERGYHEVSIEEIGAAAGITASSVYRHFPSKADLLAAAFHRASEQLTVTLGSALAESETPRQAVHTLAELYVAVFFAQSELLAVYFAEVGNLPADAGKELRKIQRRNVEEWAHLCVDARPELTVASARFLVHAALGLVLDVGRVVRFSEAERVAALLSVTLLG